MKSKLAIAVVAIAAFAPPAVARADTVTDWNQTMVNGLEAAHIPPPPAARIGAIVQASVFDAVNGSKSATRPTTSSRRHRPAPRATPPPPAPPTPRSSR